MYFRDYHNSFYILAMLGMQEEAGETGVNERRGMEDKVNKLIYMYYMWFLLRH